MPKEAVLSRQDGCAATAFHHNSLSHPSNAESIRHSDYPFAIGPYVPVAVFVDNLDFLKGLPWWTYPVPLGNNG
jgi:hypothetical protein